MKISKLSRRLLSMSYVKVLLYFLLVTIGLNIVFLIIFKGLGGLQNAAQNERIISFVDTLPTFAIYLIVGIAIPWIETMFAQVIVIEVSLVAFKRYNRRKYLAILLSAFVLGFMYRYNFVYAVSLFLSGFILAYAYIIGKKRKEPAFLLPFIVHGGWNILAFTLKLMMG